MLNLKQLVKNAKKKLKHKKNIFISRPPQILILSLQRINFITNNKKEYNVIFPEKLNLNDFIDKDFEINFNAELL